MFMRKSAALFPFALPFRRFAAQLAAKLSPRLTTWNLPRLLAFQLRFSFLLLLFETKKPLENIPRAHQYHKIMILILFSSGLYRRLGNFTRSAQQAAFIGCNYRCGISPRPKEFCIFSSFDTAIILPCSNNVNKFEQIYAVICKFLRRSMRRYEKRPPLPLQPPRRRCEFRRWLLLSVPTE